MIGYQCSNELQQRWSCSQNSYAVKDMSYYVYISKDII